MRLYFPGMPSVQQIAKLLESDPQDPFLLYAMAQEQLKQGDLPRALEFFDRAAAANPDDAYTYFHKARTLGLMGRRAEQADTLRAGIAVARRTGDGKALGELEFALDELD